MTTIKKALRYAGSGDRGRRAAESRLAGFMELRIYGTMELRSARRAEVRTQESTEHAERGIKDPGIHGT